VFETLPSFIHDAIVNEMTWVCLAQKNNFKGKN
jgi:hypothetical protein